MPFWEWNLWLGLGWILWKGLVPATPPPAPSLPIPAPLPPRSLAPANPFSSTSPSSAPLSRSVSPSLPAGDALPARGVSSPSPSPSSYAWVPSAAAGTYPAPDPGDSVWAALVDGAGMTFDVLLQAEAIDEVGNFVGIVMNAGGAPVLGVGQAITVPIAAVSWIIPQNPGNAGSAGSASGGASPAGATSGGGRKRLRA